MIIELKSIFFVDEGMKRSTVEPVELSLVLISSDGRSENVIQLPAMEVDYSFREFPHFREWKCNWS